MAVASDRDEGMRWMGLNGHNGSGYMARFCPLTTKLPVIYPAYSHPIY